MCSLLSPSVIQWDAATVFMEGVVSQIIKILEEEVTKRTESKYLKITDIWDVTGCKRDLLLPHYV